MPQRQQKPIGNFKPQPINKKLDTGKTWSYKSILPNVVFDKDYVSNTRPRENEDRISALMDRTSPRLTLDLHKFPPELRRYVYKNVLGPVKGPESSQHRKFSPIGVARRIVKFPSEASDEVVPAVSEDSDFTVTDSANATSSEYIPNNVGDHGEFFSYIPRDDYYHLESCAQRIRGMKENAKETLNEFLRHFFTHTILDLHMQANIVTFERGYGISEETELRTMPPWSQQWLNSRPSLHPYIRNISLDIDEWIMRDYVINFCRCISRKLVLSALTLWIEMEREIADEVLSIKGDPIEFEWVDLVDAIRKLVVRESFEVHVIVTEHPEKRDSVRGKELMAERKVLENLLHGILLPDTLRNPAQQEAASDEYMGLSRLFEEEEAE